jgi:hypothetical protein
MLPEPPIGTPISDNNGALKLKLGTAPVLTVKLKSPLAVAVPAVPLSAKSYPPATVEFAACRWSVVPIGGKATLPFAEVIPAGRLPRVSVTFPPIFTSDGCTIMEKLLGAYTVVGDGLTHKASVGALVAGYANGAETIGATSGFVTVKVRAPGALTKPIGKKVNKVVPLPGEVKFATETALA